MMALLMRKGNYIFVTQFFRDRAGMYSGGVTSQERTNRQTNYERIQFSQLNSFNQQEISQNLGV